MAEPETPGYAARSATKQYRTTPLRGIWQHAPYFHDGSAATLTDVVQTYNARQAARPEQPGHLRPGRVPEIVVTMVGSMTRASIRIDSRIRCFREPTRSVGLTLIPIAGAPQRAATLVNRSSSAMRAALQSAGRSN
ncbi:hypothetical protein [Cupriavidus necator]|uniref:c-type cytochrome n=1 Tax=Cupriavidus necator TaxID=106590 RepID=UPI0030F47C5C